MWMLWRVVGFFRHWWRGSYPLQSIRCPWCGFFIVDAGYLDPRWFNPDSSGVGPGTPDGPPVHWVCGVQTCPRCRYRFWVQDSD